MDFPKFRDLFANEELYLRRTDLFKETDPQDALASDDYVRAARGLRKYDLHDELALNNDQAFNRQNSEAYFINCWQVFEGETLDMWKAYGKGVAIFSRFDLLKAALAPMLDDIMLGIVRYGEKDMTGYNMIRFLYTNGTRMARAGVRRGRVYPGNEVHAGSSARDAAPCDRRADVPG
jgi:hypothetical protein